jgi:DNA-binding SARP family transcriptional activator
VKLLEVGGDYRSALRYAQRMLQQDPLDETAYVHLMRLHAMLGDRAGVRRAYENCANLLQRELDVEPDETTMAAYDQYLRVAVPHEPVVASAPLPTTDDRCGAAAGCLLTQPGTKPSAEITDPFNALSW